jgi:antitoxin HicB
MQNEYRFAVRLLSAEEGGGYLIEFPDLLGCMSDGETVAEAIANGEEAKRDWIAAMVEAGRPEPLPTAEAADAARLGIRKDIAAGMLRNRRQNR